MRDADAEKSRAIEALCEAGGPQPMFQPVVELTTFTTVGWEALSRFPVDTPNPAEWFAAAASTGQTAILESTAIRAAVDAFDAPDGFLALKASEQTLASDGFAALLSDLPMERVVLEISQHQGIADYPGLLAALADLRSMGARVAVDDTGASHSTFQHLLALAPELIKLDISLIQDIDRDRGRQALVSAMVHFASGIGSMAVAEGIETADELACLQTLGVELGQGYHLGRAQRAPQPGNF